MNLIKSIKFYFNIIELINFFNLNTCVFLTLKLPIRACLISIRSIFTHSNCYMLVFIAATSIDSLKLTIFD